ncbi:MAG: hypothetical protein ACJZ12_03930 [Candidatus Neomarinimicrobiota bacterium]
MKKLTLFSFLCLIIIMSITAMNYSSNRKIVQNSCKVNDGCIQPGCCEQIKKECKVDCVKSCCDKS